MTDGIDEYLNFLNIHKPQLIASAIPPHFWETLCKKLKNQVFDAGDVFSLMLIDYEDVEIQPEDPIYSVIVSKTNGIKYMDPLAIYLIDHAWTFRLDMARRHLEQIPGLKTRMSALMGIECNDDNETTYVDNILTKLWKYCNMYSVNATGISVENQMPIWYIMDEFGSAVNHSETPNFQIVPFMYLPEQVTYSILFPIVNCEEADTVTRNFVNNSFATKERQALLLPWSQSDFKEENYEQIEPYMEYFLAGHIEETLPDQSISPPVIDNNRPLKVFAEYDLVRDFLTDSAFEIVDNETDADVLWYTSHFKHFLELSQNSPNKFVNQFPFENVLTIKDLLSIVCRRLSHKHSDKDTLDTYPRWLPTTYNLKTELVQFVSYYQNREEHSLNNHWICKPWNLARGLDTHITSNISYLMRLPLTGPKVAQKYIEEPVLFTRNDMGLKVKFDVRYVILLKSTDPIEAYIYNNFFLRFANKQFHLHNFDDYETHFTVMNYHDDAELHHVRCADFKEMWLQQYPNHSWDDIECDIIAMLREMLLGATYKQPPCGIGKSHQSRALYAADIMLSWDSENKMQPKLLEVNWVPDCKRACDYYPDFFNDIFKLLFLDQKTDVFKLIE